MHGQCTRLMCARHHHGTCKSPPSSPPLPARVLPISGQYGSLFVRNNWGRGGLRCPGSLLGDRSIFTHHESQYCISYGERFCPCPAPKEFLEHHPGGPKIRFPTHMDRQSLYHPGQYQRLGPGGARMHLVYGNADIVIAASKSKDAQRGFFAKLQIVSGLSQSDTHTPSNALTVVLSKRDTLGSPETHPSNSAAWQPGPVIASHLLPWLGFSSAASRFTHPSFQFSGVDAGVFHNHCLPVLSIWSSDDHNIKNICLKPAPPA